MAHQTTSHVQQFWRTLLWGSPQLGLKERTVKSFYSAEMVKLMENTFRDVNIALANEFALIAEHIGVDVWEAIDIANHHPRVKILKPGPGVGGHCIAVDPWFLVEAAPEQARLIRQARLVNDGMPEHVVELVKQTVAGIEYPVIACLGLTYKANVDDVRESPAIEVVKDLIEEGYQVRAFDPHVDKPLPGMAFLLASSVACAIDGADALVVLVDHAEFRNLTPDTLAQMRTIRVVDARYCLKDTLCSTNANIVQLGVGNSVSTEDENLSISIIPA